MKFIKYLIYLILLLAIIFIALGIIKPTVKYDHEITVNKPIAEAWAVHQDETKMNQWLRGFQSIELLSGTKNEVGSTYKVVVIPSEGAEAFVMTETLLSIKENDHVAFNLDSEVMTFDQKITFKETGGGTIIRSHSEGKGKGLMMRSLFAAMDMLTGSFKKQEVENFEALKKVIETNATDYYPSPTPISQDSMPSVQD